ncbi:hypothetical protein [Paracoccus sp. T5]|uniref:hypothetical protein n=1 Tax=Paracoccus sp. T5 TaxID=3402161 RepID=UPI003AD86430
MQIFFEPQLEGVSTRDMSQLRLCEDGIYTEQDLDELCEARGHLLRQMRDAIEDRNLPRLAQLDAVYDDLSTSIESILALWPADYTPGCADKRRFS